MTKAEIKQAITDGLIVGGLQSSGEAYILCPENELSQRAEFAEKEGLLEDLMKNFDKEKAFLYWRLRKVGKIFVTNPKKVFFLIPSQNPDLPVFYKEYFSEIVLQLRTLRRDADITQEKMASLLEIGQSVTIARFENGTSFSIGLAVKYAAYFGKTIKISLTDES